MDIQTIQLVDNLKDYLFGDTQMDGKIVEQALRVLEKVEAEQFHETEKDAETQQLHRRLEKIEDILSSIKKHLLEIPT